MPPVPRDPLRTALPRPRPRVATSLLLGALLLGLSGPASAAEARAGHHADHRGWPLAPVPVVVHAFDPPHVLWGSGHRGVDLSTVPGQQVLAPRPGVVAFAGTVAGVPVVSLDHDDGTRSTYQPVVTVLTTGAEVAEGEAFAAVVPGTSHCAGRPCLHWGLRRGKEYLDPLSLVRPAQVRLLPTLA